MANTSVSGFRWAGALLAFGCAVLFVGELRYLPLGPTLGLPSSPATYADAMRIALGQESNMRLAGCVSCAGDAVIFAACLALARRQKMPAYGDLERVAWLLIGVGFVLAIVFDSLMGTVLGPVASSHQADLFRAFKGWFDFLFAIGNVFVIGGIPIFWIDSQSSAPLLPKPVDYVIIAIGILTAAGGLLYVFGLPVPPLFIGGTVILATVALGILGIQIGRREAG